MRVYLDEPDFRLWHGDVLEVLAELADGSADCVVTSPPYFGLRDYGTGLWDGGDPDCDHLGPPRSSAGDGLAALGEKYRGGGHSTAEARPQQFKSVCGKCGACRVDQQLGLEPTIDEYVANMVAVFQEVRRVLAPHGTCWLNLGDSYNSNESGGMTGSTLSKGGQQTPHNRIGKPRAGLKQKDLCMIPARVAIALQDDGWYLRSEIIWAKGISFCESYSGSVMPESATDRPTVSHEKIYLLTKNKFYYFDQHAIRERAEWSRWGAQTTPKHNGTDTAAGWVPNRSKEELDAKSTDGRNVRSVWAIGVEPYADAHFAVFPTALVRPMILAGCPEWVCRVCGEAREREVVTVSTLEQRPSWSGEANAYGVRGGNHKGRTGNWGGEKEVTGWKPCKCSTRPTVTSSSATSAETPGISRTAPDAPTDSSFAPNALNSRPGVVLDPFLGSGTTALVARQENRHALGIELNEDYCELAARRVSKRQRKQLPADLKPRADGTLNLFSELEAT